MFLDSTCIASVCLPIEDCLGLECPDQMVGVVGVGFPESMEEERLGFSLFEKVVEILVGEEFLAVVGLEVLDWDYSSP